MGSRRSSSGSSTPPAKRWGMSLASRLSWRACPYSEEIVPIQLGDGTIFDADETIRRDTSRDRLAALRPYYEGCPDITAGNASTINDGASALVLASDAAERRVQPMARVVATAVAGVEPKRFGIGPVVAIRKLLDRTGLTAEQIFLYAINEAFACQMIACIRELGLDPHRVNVNGGAIALGHALGNSGARITTTLLHELRRRGDRYGIAALCIGSGQGIATLFETIPA